MPPVMSRTSGRNPDEPEKFAGEEIVFQKSEAHGNGLQGRRGLIMNRCRHFAAAGGKMFPVKPKPPASATETRGLTGSKAPGG